MNEITRQPEGETYRPSAAIDPTRLEYLWTLTERIASSSLVPESLRTEGPANKKTDLPRDVIVANVFAVVEQADRWNISPFALLACAAIVHGRLGFEGKVIAAVLESLFHIKLHHYFTGDPRSEQHHIYLCDEPLPDDIIAELKPGYRHPRFKIMDGSVAEWKTTGNGSPWRPATYTKMLVYRGSREWPRVYKPGAIMGVLGDDELYEIGMERQAQLARDITPSLNERFGGRQSADGFNPDNVKQLTNSGQVAMETIDPKTGEILKTEVQRTAAVTEKTTSSSAKAASAKPASDDAGRSGGNSSPVDDSRSTNSSQGSDDRSKSDDGGKSEGAIQRLPAELFKKYASSLARMQTEANVDKASAMFWQDNGGAPKGGVDRALAKSIYDKQMARAKGDTDADGLLDEIHADIDTSFSGSSDL
ncbi:MULTISPECIES: hypothetical protein [Mesorhizobium]|uniref:hypothetical protein n=1 Tax=Mesorhizobium TaxID=68287 RepID=UPI0007A94BA6|nr:MULTISPECIES: hypothetical protein [Mesorhizobium]AMX93738.1 hypothetical protein A4R28_11800 [Mesorhizobium ciceri]MDF3208439.1 hypothetical protein [Mesorhizobium sp. LMG15046]MDF3228990.1 hypothetical protein [Mesorhizobium sp. DSM 30133]RUU22108.1 hypothetical protein EOC84_03085 [Mesorhizobium sp. Primo-B]RUU37982.1 hypothetical protein EOC83_17130 [Mesorhizobium sp. Primo-A]